MTEFTETAMRHMCRYPKCRSKLPAPVSNPREAFCARSCHTSFYRKRCLVCERLMERKTEHQLVCGKRTCRKALRASSDLGRYGPSSDVISSSKKPENKGLGEVVTDGRAWRQMAGPELSPDQIRAAAVPDGGEQERIEAKNRPAVKAAEQAEIEADGEFTEPGWREVINPDGVRCFVTRFRDATPHQARSKQAADVTDDLSIPPFLGHQLKTGSGLGH
jgi:hypothetical protein